jgi:integrase
MDYFKEEESPLPYIPREAEIDQLISGCNPSLACFLQTMKETAFRPGEVLRLTSLNIDVEKRVITLTKPEKRSNHRQARMSSKLAAMITPLVHLKKPNEKIWQLNYDSICQTFLYTRRRIGLKVANPSLERITFKTFRHWKATTEYHRTKDILYVKELLGHKSLKNTLVYTHLVSFEEEDAYIVKVASTIKEFTTLLESGFEYVSDYEGKKILRKRK